VRGDVGVNRRVLNVLLNQSNELDEVVITLRSHIRSDLSWVDLKHARHPTRDPSSHVSKCQVAVRSISKTIRTFPSHLATMSCTHIDAPGDDPFPIKFLATIFDNLIELRAPTATQSVYREDCTQCFDSIDDPSGLNVCLYCFNGGCAGDRNHAALHSQSHSHPLVLNIKRKRKQIDRDEPRQKISKLAISAETETDRYETNTRVECYECGVKDVDKSSGKLPQVVDAVMRANTFARQEEVKAWEQEMTACEHTLCLEQEAPRTIASGDLGHCAMCDLKENLWLCLTCGNLGCGRAQYGGVGGNSHGLAHVDASQHTVAVKLGSLTADGTADIYCYACNEERVDPELATHLAHWGINIADRQKTEKSLTELQIEQNLKWEFSMATADGKELKPLFGAGFTGLKNLGNSCYLASILQCLFSFPEFQQRYYQPDAELPPTQHPAEDLETQMRKVADGLLSGRYSHPDSDIVSSEDSPEVPHQKGIAPAMLKHLIGRGHSEFSTMRQQDAFELLLHLLQLITRSQHPSDKQNPVDAFKFVMEQRLQCTSCMKVRYRTDEMDNISIPVPIRRIPKADVTMTDVSSKAAETASGDKADNSKPTQEKEQFEPIEFKECLDIFTSTEQVEFTCPSCNNKSATKRSLFKTFPTILAINARRFEVVNWLPTKQDVPVIVSDSSISFDDYRSLGQQEHEELLPEDASASSSSSTDKFVPNANGLDMLTSMGFPEIRCVKALKATGNTDVEAASNWLFEHMEDADIDEPLPEESSASSAGNLTIDPAQIEDLGAMGFSAPQARQALKETGGNMERAVDWLFSHPDAQGDFGDNAGAASTTTPSNSKPQALPGRSADQSTSFQLQSIACHKGSSIHAGHYVAFVRKELPEENQEAWVLFNDEKVAKAEPENVEEMKRFAYVYFFRRT
jgi:ubiquitin carboxyl-terminal hydrolase 5/13